VSKPLPDEMEWLIGQTVGHHIDSALKRGAARIRELEAELAKEKGGWKAFYKLRKAVGEARYPGMIAEVTARSGGAVNG
jgi:hypothetical protein